MAKKEERIYLPINKIYSKEIRKHSVINEIEINQLSQKYKQGDEFALTKIIEGCLRLVLYYAKQYQNAILVQNAFEFNDIVSQGNIGLITAAKKYNPESGASFSYFASFYIKNEIVRFLQNNNSSIRYPCGKLEKLKELENFAEAFYNNNQYDASEDEFRNLQLYKEDDIDFFFNRAIPERYSELIETSENCDEFDFIRHENQKSMVEAAMTSLNELECDIINYVFGFIGEPQSFSQIGNKINRTPSGVHYHYKRAIKKIKHFFNQQN